MVTNAETFIRWMFAGFVVWVAGVWLMLPVRGALAWTLVSAVFLVALKAADERAEFVFDGRQRVVRWRQDTAFRHAGGEIPFSAITGLSLERDFTRQNRAGNARRLVLLTTSGPVPVTTAYTGVGSAARDAGQTVRAYLADATGSPPVSFSTD